MGTFYSRIKNNILPKMTSRKRKREDIEGNTELEVIAADTYVPQKKKLLTTPQYIYQALFKEQRDSDISIQALEETWHLHKVYLCQSKYFACMFNGDWIELNKRVVNIEILDPNISPKALEIVFGSLYADEVTIDPKTVISVIAAASLFQLDGLIEQCSVVMIETINAETIISYYEAACQYGCVNVKNAAYNWLLINLLSYVDQHSQLLSKINPTLMTELVKNGDLFVLQTELSLYLILRFWLYLKLFPDTPEKLCQSSDAIKYFVNRKDEKAFILTKCAEKYREPFSNLRFQHLINHPSDLKLILEDNIIPRSLLNEPLLTQWFHMIRIDQAIESGPNHNEQSFFDSSCMRCGRVIDAPGFHKWRWTGFNFGLDLILIADGKCLSIKRHHRYEHERLLSLQMKRNFFIRTRVYSLNDQRQIKQSQSTGILTLQLLKNEEVPLLQLENTLTYPMLVSVNLQIVSPKSESSFRISTNDSVQCKIQK